jgi:hypothetical protein
MTLRAEGVSENEFDRYFDETLQGMLGKHFDVAGRGYDVATDDDAAWVVGKVMDELGVEGNEGSKQACDSIRNRIGMDVNPNLKF